MQSPLSTNATYSPLPCVPANYMASPAFSTLSPQLGGFSPVLNTFSPVQPQNMNLPADQPHFRRASVAATVSSAGSPLSDDGSSDSLYASSGIAVPSLASSLTSSASSSLSGWNLPNHVRHAYSLPSYGSGRPLANSFRKDQARYSAQRNIPLGQDPQMISLLAAADVSPRLFAWSAEPQELSPGSPSISIPPSYQSMHALASGNDHPKNGFMGGRARIPRLEHTTSLIDLDADGGNAFGLTVSPPQPAFAAPIMPSIASKMHPFGGNSTEPASHSFTYGYGPTFF